MRAVHKLALRLRSLFRRRSVDAELDREMQFHLDNQIEEFISAGMSPQDARFAAMRTLGNLAGLKEQCREQRGLSLFEEAARNIKYAARALRRNPTFTVVAVLSLALGIGATTTIFTLLYTTVLNPLTYTDAHRLVILEPTNTAADGTVNAMPWSYPKFQDAQSLTSSFDATAGFAPAEFSVTEAGEPERVKGEYVSATYFSVLGIRPIAGRTFHPDEDKSPNSPALLVISEDFWRRKFNSDPSVIGRSIRINRIPFEIVGVTPATFRGETGTAELWIPISMAPAVSNIPARLTRRFSHWFRAIGRLNPDVSIAQADEDLRQAVHRYEELQPSDAGSGQTFSGRVVPLLEAKVDPGVRRSLTVLLTAVGFVLLITCLNLSNLLFSRWMARQNEISVRLAIGASRWTLIRQFMTESFLLAALGGAAALLVAFGMLRLLPLLEPAGLLTGGSSTFIRGLNFDLISLQRPEFLLFNLALSVITAVSFGTVPAIRASRPGAIAQAVKSGQRKLTVRQFMVVTQVALAVVLSVGAGVMLRSFDKLLKIDVGINAENLVTFRVDLPGNVYAKDAPRQFFQDLTSRIAALPGVENASLASTIPLRGQNEVTMGSVDGKPAGQVSIHITTPNYFQILGIPLLRGRIFSEAEGVNSPHVAVISESAAKRFFGDEDPIGHTITRVSQPGQEAQIIGVVGNSKYRLIEMAPDADVYVSHLQADPWPGNYVLVKTAIEPELLIPLLRVEVQKLDPQIPLYGVTTMTRVVADATARTRFSSVLLGIFAGLALLVAGIGVYGMLTYAVSQRTREIGIRIALGAERSRIGRMIVGEGIILCVAGLCLGLIGAYGTTRLLQGLLYQITPTDPATFVAVTVLLGIVAWLACWVPARRATRVDPIIALRYE